MEGYRSGSLPLIPIRMWIRIRNIAKKNLRFLMVKIRICSGCAHGSGSHYCDSYRRPLQDCGQKAARASNGGTPGEPRETLAVWQVAK